ncbi:MAG TPA: SDR family NAD(P)-dependent oxidoreductase [Candidatus Angelobacter sp.]|nr:SDR family NAD(P)-dependent oxidoreductase [Candidatus Angelobacter sp.]
MSEIKGAVAVITGAGSGIGRALAMEMARRGAALALADVNVAGLEETRALLSAQAARTYTVDVADPSSVADFAEAVQRDFGRASLLVNNAGVALYGTFAEISLADMDWLMRINYWGVVHGCKFFLPLLEREPDARIVNISSVFGLFGPPGQSAYCSSKYAVRGFSECLREELRASNVKVTCVHPGGIATRIAENARAGSAANTTKFAQDRQRFAKVAITTPEEAARVIVKGITGNKDRVLIGSDARRIALLQRIFPVRATAMLTAWLQKQLASADQSPAELGDSHEKGGSKPSRSHL